MWAKAFLFVTVCSVLLGCKTQERVRSSEFGLRSSLAEESRDSVTLASRERVIYLRDTVTVTERVTEYAPPVVLRDTVLTPVERVIYRTVSTGASSASFARDTTAVTASAAAFEEERSVVLEQTASERQTDDKSGGYFLWFIFGLTLLLALLGLIYRRLGAASEFFDFVI